MKRALGLLVAVVGVALAAGPEPAKAGLDAQRVARIPERMKAYVEQGAVSGVVTLIERRGTLALLDAQGLADVASKTPMKTDTIFQIMSMTKPVTGVAIMMLVDEGKIRLNDPVERHIPEFRGQWVVQSKTGETQVLGKPARPITIRDLMSHTSGLPAMPPAGMGELLWKMDKTLGEAVAIYSQMPLEFEPGSRWMYSNPGIATLGRIVEVASDTTFEKFLETRIFQPLGMKDSHIFLPAEKQARLATNYVNKDGKLAVAPTTTLAGASAEYRKGAKYSGPEYALHATAADLALFYEMMRNKGLGNGKRLLSPFAVETMTALHTGELKAGHNPGTGFGLTWEVTKDTLGTLTGQSVGTFGHGGAFGTYGWIDPKKELVGVFMIQGSTLGAQVRDAFVEMAAGAIVN